MLMVKRARHHHCVGEPGLKRFCVFESMCYSISKQRGMRILIGLLQQRFGV
jgi:hypothetical protein